MHVTGTAKWKEKVQFAVFYKHFPHDLAKKLADFESIQVDFEDRVFFCQRDLARLFDMKEESNSP